MRKMMATRDVFSSLIIAIFSMSAVLNVIVIFFLTMIKIMHFEKTDNVLSYFCEFKFIEETMKIIGPIFSMLKFYLPQPRKMFKPNWNSLDMKLLFSSSKAKEMSLVKMNRVQNSLMGDWTNISQQIPADIHQILAESGCISPITSSLESFSESAILNTHYRRIFNKTASAPFAASFNSPIISQFLMNCVRQLSSYPDIFLDSTCYLTSALSEKSNIKMGSNEIEMCNATLKASCESAPLIQLVPTVKTLNNVPHVDKQAKLVEYECKKNAHVYNLELSNRKTKELQKRSKKRRRRQKKIQAKASCPLFESSPATSIKNNDAKSSESSGISSKVTKNPLETMDFFHDILSNSNLCDKNTHFSTVDNSSSVHILLPGVASLLISVESISDEDSEWDELGCSDWISTTEFEASGLFMPNLTVSACSSSQKKSAACEDAIVSAERAELEKMREILKVVNQSWNEAMKDTAHQPKVPSKVTFAEDINLVEVCPVEICDRKGEWELYALERIRFKRRIGEIDKILSPYLRTEHREKVFRKLYPLQL